MVWEANFPLRQLYPRQRDPVTIVRRLDGPRGQSGRIRKISPPLTGLRSLDRPAFSPPPPIYQRKFRKALNVQLRRPGLARGLLPVATGIHKISVSEGGIRKYSTFLDFCVARIGCKYIYFPHILKQGPSSAIILWL